MNKLDSIALISAGNASPKKQDFSAEGIPFVRAGSLEFLTRGISIDNCEKVGPTIAKQKKLRLFPKGAILFAKSGMSAKMGRIYMLEKDAYVVSHLAIIEAKKDKILPEFLKYYFINKPPFNLIKDDAYPSIRLSDISQILIDTPSINIQKKIIDILVKAEEITKKRSKTIDLLDDFLRSTFSEFIDKTDTKPMEFKFFAKIGSGLVNPKEEEFADMKHIGIGNIKKETGEIINTIKVRDSELQSGKYLFTENDIIYSKIRPNLNKVALPDFTGLCSADAYVVSPIKEEITKYFLAYLLRSKEYVNYAVANSGRAQMPKVNRKTVEAFQCSLPSLPLQKIFEKQAIKKELLRRKLVISLKESENLFLSLTKEVFENKINFVTTSKAQIDLSNKRKSINWFYKQIEEIRGASWENVNKSWNDLRMSWNEIKNPDELDEKLADLNLPLSGSTEAFENRMKEGGIPYFGEVNLFDHFNFIQSDPLFKEMGLSDNFRLLPYEESVRKQESEEEQKRNEPSEYEVELKREETIKALKFGRIQIDNEEVHLPIFIFEQFGLEEFTFKDLIEELNDEYSPDSISTKEIRGVLHEVILEYTSIEGGLSVFQFDKMERVVSEGLMNIEYKFLNNFVTSSLELGALQQIYYPWNFEDKKDIKKYSKVFDKIKKTGKSDKSGIYLFNENVL